MLARLGQGGVRPTHRARSGVVPIAAHDGSTVAERILVVVVAVALSVPLFALPARAAANLTITPNTWNVVGLDSNNVNTGPNQFLAGARICNTGDVAASDVQATFVWDTAATYINLQPGSGSTRSTTSLAAGACWRAFFNVEITRNSSAYNTARRFHISATASGLGTVSTPTPREIYVEKLVSQNRNSVQAITGPTTVYVGGTYTYTVDSSTATQGYEQLSSFLNWPGAIFEVQSISTTYSSPVGGTNNTVYADACGWDNDPASGDYRSCVGPVNYSRGKAGGTIPSTYTVKVVSPGTSTIGETIYDFSGSSYHYNSDYGVGVASYTITAVNPTADVSIAKSDDPDPVIAGEELTYTLTATNNGPSPAGDVVVTDDLPNGTTFVSASDGGTESGGTVTWNLGTLADDQSEDLTLVVAVNASRTADLSNTAEISTSSTDPTPGNNSANEDTTVETEADVSITKSDAPDPVPVGDQLVYTLEVTNDGPSNAQLVTVADTLPDDLTIDLVDTTAGSCTTILSTVTCILGTMAPGTTETVTVTVTPAMGAVPGVSNTATVSTTTTDPTPGNDEATEETEILPPADLSITKTDDVDPVVAGDELTYTLEVTNDGPATATDVTVTDPVPAGTTFVSATDGGSESGGIVTWDLGSIAVGASTSVDVAVRVDPARTTDVANTATVEGSTYDPDPSNDDASEDTAVTAEADLELTKSDGSDTIGAGVSGDYTITLTNHGPSTVPSGVIVSDPPPAGTTISTAEVDCSVLANTATCTTPSALDPGESVSWIMTVDVPGGYADPTVENTASITFSPVIDPEPGNDTSTDVDSVVPVADLVVTKDDDVDPVVPGTDLTYTIGVSNAGPASAQNVELTDPLPAGTSFVSATGGGSESGGVVTWTLGTLASGASTSVDLTVHVDAGWIADLSNTATAAGSTFDPTPDDAEDTEPTVVIPQADLSITKADDADPVVAGEGLTYTLTVTNDGPSDAADVTITDPLPAGTTFVSATGGGTEVGGDVAWDLGTLASGASTSVDVTVLVDPEQTADLANIAAVDASTSDPDGSNNNDDETTAVTPEADLELAKTDGTSTIGAGVSAVYTITLTNLGPSTVPAGVVVSDPAPAGTTISTAEADCSVVANTVECTTSAGLAPGASVAWDVTVDVPAGYADPTVENTASITSSPVTDPEPGNDTATDTDTIVAVADLVVTKSDDADPVVAGTDLTYTIEVANAGPAAAQGVVLTDPVPTGTTFVSASDGGTEAAGVVTWSLGAIASGASTSVDVTVHVDPGRTADLSNTATAEGSTLDPTPADAADTEPTAVSPEADVSITKTSPAGTAEADTDATFTIRVRNDGPSDAEDVVVTDPIPAGMTYVSATDGGTEAGGVVTWTLGTVAAGDMVTVHVTVHIDASTDGLVTNTAEVTSSTPDPDASDIEASDDVLVVPPAGVATNLRLTKTADRVRVGHGSTISYTIAATNLGPGIATNVVVLDRLPDGLAYVGSSTDWGSYDPATGEWTIGTIQVGQRAILRIRATVDPTASGRSIVNEASIDRMDQPDTTPDDDVDSRTVVLDAHRGPHEGDQPAGGPAVLPGRGLAVTGSDVGVVIPLLITLVILGAAATFVGRRRRSSAL